MENALFLLKKFLGGLLMPVPMILLLLIWALLFLVRRKTRWCGILFVFLATGLLLVASYAPLSSRVTGILESHYPSYQVRQASADYICVLGSGHVSGDNLPLTSELDPTAVVRLAEGIRIYRLNPGSKLILTGFYGRNPTSFSETLKQLAVALGVPEGDLRVFTGPRDTAEEVRLIAENFSGKSMVLVTSAAHMPRAMGLFRRAGLEPVPAPTNHLARPTHSYWVFPDAKTLEKSHIWLHEQLGLIWAKLMGTLDEQT